MQRSSSIALGGLVLLALAALIWKGGPKPAPTLEKPSWSAALSASARPLALSISAPSAWTLPSVALPEPPEPAFDRSIAARPLPPGSPRNVRIGIILFRYRGAELAPFDARSKAEALNAAKAAREAGKKDFKEAVKLGDPGSTDDAGKFARKILEPAVEYEIFTLGPGALSEPIDTPRGYWIARRIE